MTRLKQYMIESAASGGVQKYFKKIQKMKPDKAEKFMKSSWKELSNALKSRALEDDAIQIINKHFHTNYRRLIEIDNAKIAKLPTKKVYEELIVEDLSNYWNFIKTEAFPALSFYPILQVFMELDKLIKGAGGDSKIMIFYGIMWLFLVSGRFIKLWKEWKTKNPDEFKKEGSRKNPFAIKKKSDFSFE